MILGGDNYTVYKHTSPIGKVYIGITKMNPIRRWSNGKVIKDVHIFIMPLLNMGGIILDMRYFIQVLVEMKLNIKRKS